MKNLFHDIASQFGKAFAQELLKTNQEQVPLISSQPTVEIPIVGEKIVNELSANQQNTHPFTEEDYLRFIETFSEYKDCSIEEIREKKEIDLSNNQITDISPLENLVNLETLYLESNRISDISALSNLINLESLYLSGNQVSDLSPLKNLVNLEELSLWSNQISDISPLKNLVNLKKLNLNNNQVSDISPLRNLINLGNLYLACNQISDLSPIKNIIYLSELDLTKNKILDISFLKDMIIEILWLDGNLIDNPKYFPLEEKLPNCKLCLYSDNWYGRDTK